MDRIELSRALTEFKYYDNFAPLMDIIDPRPVIKYRYDHFSPEGTAPQYMREGDSCFDLVAAENACVSLGATTVIHTGLHLEIPDGFDIRLEPRSGLAKACGVQVLGGVIDGPYRGEIVVLLTTCTQLYTPYVIQKGDRIAQCSVRRVVRATFERAEELSQTERGEQGFGSSGK